MFRPSGSGSKRRCPEPARRFVSRITSSSTWLKAPVLTSSCSSLGYSVALMRIAPRGIGSSTEFVRMSMGRAIYPSPQANLSKHF